MRRNGDKEVIIGLAAFHGFQYFLIRIHLFHIEKHLAFDTPFFELRNSPLGDGLQRSKSVDRIGKENFNFIQHVPLFKVSMKHKGQFERGHRTFVRDACCDYHSASVKTIKGISQFYCTFKIVKPMSALLQSRDQFRHYSGTCSDNKIVVREIPSAFSEDDVPLSVYFYRSIDKETYARVQKVLLFSDDFFRTHFIKYNIQEPRLICMIRRIGQHGDQYFAAY